MIIEIHIRMILLDHAVRFNPNSKAKMTFLLHSSFYYHNTCGRHKLCSEFFWCLILYLETKSFHCFLQTGFLLTDMHQKQDSSIIFKNQACLLTLQS